MKFACFLAYFNDALLCICELYIDQIYNTKWCQKVMQFGSWKCGQSNLVASVFWAIWLV